MSIDLESAARIAALRDKADAVTGETSQTLAGAVDALIAGFGQGDTNEDAIIARTISGTYRNNRVTTIGSYGLAYCNGITSLELPAVTTIGSYGLAYCNGITSLELPAVTILGNAFRESTAVEIIKLPNLKTVGYKYNFYECYALRIVDLPVVESFENEKQFVLANNFVALILRGGTVPGLHVNALAESTISNGTGYIYVPAALVDSYKAATNWATYADQFRALEDYTVDGTITGELDETKI